MNKKIASLNSRVQTLHMERVNIEKAAKTRSDERFESNNGCTTCAGRGWVVTWDTLDCMQGSYAEYGECPEENCTQETRALSGFNTRNSKYDRNRGTRWTPTYTQDESRRISEINNETVDLKRSVVVEENLWSICKGKIVRVTKQGKGPKARRVPVGTEGLVERLFSNGWGTEKLIVKDKDGKQWWPHSRLCEVIDPNPDLSPWKNMEKTEVKETGFPLIVRVKRLTEKAALVIPTHLQKEEWIPRNQCVGFEDAKVGEAVMITIPMWLAKKKGLVTDG